MRLICAPCGTEEGSLEFEAMREGRQVGPDHWAGQGIYFRERKDHGAASRTPTAGVSGIAPGGLLLGHHRFAISTVVRMLHRDDNAVAAVHLARIMRPPDQIPVSMSMMPAMGNHMMHRSIMRPMRQSPERS